jgi:DNA repair ATPase RecN
MPPTSSDRPLGRQLLETLADVNALYAKATTVQQIEDLDRQRARLLQQIGTLVDRHLNSASREYREATQALQGASDEIKAALQRLERVAQAITVLAQALDAVAKLAAA